MMSLLCYAPQSKNGAFYSCGSWLYYTVEHLQKKNYASDESQQSMVWQN